ncbi:MAG: hypothetical protein AAFZ65_12945 [Planctomycetota bacterium]
MAPLHRLLSDRRVPLAVAVALTVSSCASVSFTRETETSGRFESSGIAFTLLSFDFPKRAIDIARENASDSRQPNMQVDHEWIFPNLGPFDWLLDIIGIRYAKVSGSWGFAPGYEESAGAR